MAEAVAEHSYGSTTIAHVVSHAGVSRKTFYEHFRDKEHCFLAMYDTGIAFVLGRLTEALEAAEDPRERLVAGVRDVPDRARRRARLLPRHRARGATRPAPPGSPSGGRCCRCSRAATWRSTARRASADPTVEPLSGDVALGVVGAILELVSTRVEEGRTAELAELTEPLSDFVIRNVLATAA